MGRAPLVQADWEEPVIVASNPQATSFETCPETTGPGAVPSGAPYDWPKNSAGSGQVVVPPPLCAARFAVMTEALSIHLRLVTRSGFTGSNSMSTRVPTGPASHMLAPSCPPSTAPSRLASALKLASEALA